MTDLTVPGKQEPKPEKKPKPAVGPPKTGDALGDLVSQQAFDAETKAQRQRIQETFDPLNMDFLGGEVRQEFQKPRLSLDDSEVPDHFAESMFRLIKSYADVIAEPLEDTSGRVLRDPVQDPAERLVLGLAALDKFLESDAGPDQVMKFMGGGGMPMNFLPPKGKIESIEDFKARKDAEILALRAEAGREDANPLYLALRDYVIDPLGEVFPAMLQVGSDLVIGASNVANRAGLYGPLLKAITEKTGGIPHFDVKEVIHRDLGGTTLGELNAIAAAKGDVGKALLSAGQMVGTVAGFGAGRVGQAVGAAGKVGESVGKALFGRAGVIAGQPGLSQVGRVIGHDAGSFAFIEGVSQEGFAGLGTGAAAGGTMGLARSATAAMLRKLFRAKIDALPRDERSMMTAMQGWGVKNKVYPEAGETMEAFEKRFIDTYIAHGLPGAPPMTGRKIVGWALQSTGTNVGFSAIDHQLREDFIAAAFNGEPEKWRDVAVRFSGNYLGSALITIPAARIVPFQRKGRVEATGKPPSAEIRPEEVTLPKPPESRPEGKGGQAEAFLESATLPNWDPRSARKDQSIRVEIDPKTKRARYVTVDEPRPEWSPAINQGLGSYGWDSSRAKRRPGRPRAETIDQPPTEVRIAGSNHSFRVEGETAYPSKELRQALDLPESLPASTMSEIAEVASLASALNRANLPGTWVSAEGWTAVPGIAAEKGRFYRTVNGQLQESPLEVPQRWKNATDVPLRGKDAIPPEQRNAVDLMQSALMGRDDLSPADRILLSKSMHLLDSVSAMNDIGVRETLPEMPKFAQAVEQYGPSAAIRGLAESLTTKIPGLAMVDMAKRAQVEGRPEVEAPAQAREIEALEMLLESVQTELGRAREVAGRGEREPTRQGELAPEQREALAESGSLRELLAEEAQLEQFNRAKKSGQDKGTGEEGYVSGDVAHAARVLLTDNLLTRTSKRLWDAFQKSVIGVVRARGMKEEADLGANATAKSEDFQAELNAAGVSKLRRTSRIKTRGLGERVRDKNGGWADVFSRAMDAGQAGHWGDVALTKTQQDIVDMVRAVVFKAGQQAESIGVQITNKDGSNPQLFKADPNRRVLPRILSARAARQIHNGEGPIYEALIQWLEATYNWTRSEAVANFTDAKSLIRLDATEVRRSIPALPVFVEVRNSLGIKTLERVLETRPIEYAQRLAQNSSYALGARSELARFSPTKAGKQLDARAKTDILGVERKTETKAEAEAKEYKPPDSHEVLPESAQEFVNRVYAERGLEAAEAVYQMVRAIHGLDPYAPRTRIGQILPQRGDPGYRFFEFLGALAGVAKGGLLTLSFPVNIVEPSANTPFLGEIALAQAYRRVLQSLLTGKFSDLHSRAVVDGFVADTKLNQPVMGDNLRETVINITRQVASGLYTPMRMSQDFAEMVNVEAARIRLEEMRSGNGSRHDRRALSQLGFEKAEIDAMLRGEGTEKQYARYRTGISGSLAGGKSQRMAEKSRAGLSPTFNSLVWFTNFFQNRSRLLTSLANDIVEAKGAKDTWLATQGLINFGAMTIIGSGVAGGIMRKYLTGNSQGVADYVRESLSSGDAGDIISFLFQNFSSGVVGGMGQPIADVVRNLAESPEDLRENIGRTLTRFVAPADATIEFLTFLDAIVFDGDHYGYENKNALGKTGVYLRRILPLYRSAHEGLFGISAIAFTEKDQAIDRALDSRARWIRDNKKEVFEARGIKNDREESREFRDSIRAAIDRVMARKDFRDQDLIDAVVGAMAADVRLAQRAVREGADPEMLSDAFRSARSSVAMAFRGMRKLPEAGKLWSQAEIDALYKHLGDTHLQTLQDWDLTVETMATVIAGSDFTGMVAARLAEEGGK